MAISRNQREGLSLIAPALVACTSAWVVRLRSARDVYVYTAENDETFVTIMIMSGITALFLLWSDVFSAVFTGLERMSVLAVLAAAGKLATLLATITVLALGFGVVGVVGVSIVDHRASAWSLLLHQVPPIHTAGRQSLEERHPTTDRHQRSVHDRDPRADGLPADRRDRDLPGGGEP